MGERSNDLINMTGKKVASRKRANKVMTPKEEKALYDFVEMAIDWFDHEDLEYYSLKLNRDHRCMDYFSEKDIKEIKPIINALIKDTKRHADLLDHVIKLCE